MPQSEAQSELLQVFEPPKGSAAVGGTLILERGQCDKVLPVCGFCAKASADCVYDHRISDKSHPGCVVRGLRAKCRADLQCWCGTATCRGC